MMGTISGSVWIAQSTPMSQRVFWEIEDPKRRMQESDTLLSDDFRFGGKRWRLLLLTDTPYVDASLSIFGTPEETSLFPVVWWHAGVVDSEGDWHYDRRGYVRIVEPTEEWIPVAEWAGPEWSHMFLEKDRFLPGGCMTLVIQLSWGPALDDCTLEDPDGPVAVLSSPEDSSRDIFVKVIHKTFRVQKAILETFLPVLGAIIPHPSGENQIQVVEVVDCDPQTFEIVLSFLSTGSLDEVKTERLKELYHVADKYAASELKQQCVQKLLTTLTAESVSDAFSFAKKCGNEELLEGTTAFFLKNALDVFRTPAWLQFMASDTTFANDLVILSHERLEMDSRKTITNIQNLEKSENRKVPECICFPV